jgi:hypothetical protein
MSDSTYNLLVRSTSCHGHFEPSTWKLMVMKTGGGGLFEEKVEYFTENVFKANDTGKGYSGHHVSSADNTNVHFRYKVGLKVLFSHLSMLPEMRHAAKAERDGAEFVHVKPTATLKIQKGMRGMIVGLCQTAAGQKLPVVQLIGDKFDRRW